jgi:hypothetical protein
MDTTAHFIPNNYLEDVIEKTSNVLPTIQEELEYLRNSLKYLAKGMNADEAVDMATFDYLKS